MNSSSSTSSISSGTPTNGRSALLAWPWLVAAVLLLLASTWLAWWQSPLPVLPNWSTQPFSFWKPIEVNARSRLPKIEMPLGSVGFSSDGQRGWVVGASGVVISTRDSGKKWSPQTSGTQNNLSSVWSSASGEKGWAVGRDGAIVFTVDGGQTWAAQNSGVKDWLSFVFFLADGMQGWAVGEDGIVIFTSNAGKTWVSQTSGTKEWLQSVTFHSDGKRGWAVGGGSFGGKNATIIATSDGGKTWASQISRVQSNLNSVFFHTDGMKGWAVGDDGIVIVTSNAGENWVARISGTKSRLESVFFQSDGKRGWAVGSHGTIVSSSDGGITWEAQNIGSKANLRSLAFHADGILGWVVGDHGVVFTSSDGGKNWIRQSSGADARLFAVTFLLGGQAGWAVGDEGLIIATSDYGETWTPRASGTTSNLRSVSFPASRQKGWAAGENGVIIATTDGGKTWTPQTSGTGNSLRGVFFQVDEQRGWAVGDEGVIITTKDGGKTWSPQASGTKMSLSAISFQADGEKGWAVGGRGVIITTRDGGENWTRQASTTIDSLNSVFVHANNGLGLAVGNPRFLDGGTVIVATTDAGRTWKAQYAKKTVALRSVSFRADGNHGWAVGSRGTVVSTIDGGQTWTPQNSGTQVLLNSIAFQANGEQGWAVGDGGVIITTTDGGKNWKYAESYARYPAPWYWLAVLIAAGLAWLAWAMRPTGIAGHSVADIAASDAEVRLPINDKLEFGGLARGISRFLRNRETRPPLTLAITGDWGSGKSSLMQLVCADMKRFGHKPVWFNAWHHQKQEHLFAALLGAVRAQAVPRLLSLPGVLLRLRLLWLRSRKHFLVALLLLLAVTTLTVLAMDTKSSGWLQSLAKSTDWHALKSLPFNGEWLAGIAAALTAALGVLKGAKPFGLNPSLLLANVRDNMSLKTAAAQNDFRAQFAQQFGEMVQALPQRLVIVIDDLDRCSPTAVLEVMETVNYLTSAGECFVIFGMASERVQAALGLAFKDIAAEMVQLDKHQAGAAETGGPAAIDAALAKRRDYAADYLQKLVNIEIKVPSRQDVQAHLLLTAPEPAPRRTLLDNLAALLRLWPVLAVALTLAGGWWLANMLSKVEPPQPPLQASTSTFVVATPTVAVATPAQTVPVMTKTAQATATPTVPSFVPGASASASSVLVWVLLALTPILGVGIFIVLRLLRSTILETRDSQQFRDALEIWTSVVASKRSTPRAIKRFGNRIRYLAMLQQGEDKDETQLDLIRALVRQWLRSPSASSENPPPKPGALAEHQLIAFGAIQEIYGDAWLQKLPEALEGLWDQFLDDPVSPEVRQAQFVRAAVAEHQTKFKTDWPPSQAEIEVFQKLMAGVRLAGDPQIIEPTVGQVGRDAENSVSDRKQQPQSQQPQQPQQQKAEPGRFKSSSPK